MYIKIIFNSYNFGPYSAMPAFTDFRARVIMQKQKNIEIKNIYIMW